MFDGVAPAVDDGAEGGAGRRPFIASPKGAKRAFFLEFNLVLLI